jgi:hypothetical protein
MQFLIEGTSKNLSMQEAEFATKFFAGKLMSPQLIRHLSIIVRFKNLPNHKGLTDVLDCPYKPREFLLTIRPRMSRMNQLRTLAHEIVHVKQFAKKELGVIVHGSLVKWKNEFIDDNKVSYWEQPWEIEAFGREGGLVMMYNEALIERNRTILLTGK